MTQYQKRPLVVGEKVYLVQYYNWSEAVYTPGNVIRVTPAGMYVIRYEETDLIFRPDGKRRGDAYPQLSIDWTPFAKREQLVSQSNRLREAIVAVLNIAEFEKPTMTWELGSLIALMQKIEVQVKAAQEAIMKVE